MGMHLAVLGILMIFQQCAGQEASKVCNSQDLTPGSSTLGNPAFCAGICLGPFKAANSYPLNAYGDEQGRNCLECERIWVVSQSLIVNTCQLLGTPEYEMKRSVYTADNPISSGQFQVFQNPLTAFWSD